MTASTNVNNLAKKLNPQQKEDLVQESGRQTVELRSPDGSALIHLLLAGITMAAEWGITHADSIGISERLYVTGNIFKDESLLKSLAALPKSCIESARILVEKRNLYERSGVFPSSVIDYTATMLKKENDEFMNRTLSIDRSPVILLTFDF
jgi:glutamine synthetase